MHKPVIKKSRLGDDEWVWYCTGCGSWRARPSWRTALRSALVHFQWTNGLVK